MVNVHQVTIPGGSPYVPSVKALGNTKNTKKTHTLDWDPEILLKFANIDTIKDALSFNPHTENIW